MALRGILGEVEDAAFAAHQQMRINPGYFLALIPVAGLVLRMVFC